MEPAAKELLGEIGRQLNLENFPEVTDGGLVMPSRSRAPISSLGLEKKHGNRREGQQEGQGSSGAPGAPPAPGAPGPSGPAASVVVAKPADYEAQLGGLHQVYPGAKVWHEADGLWLMAKSDLLPSIREHAIFLVGISLTKGRVRSWAFWGDPIALPSWIGPRHTNFTDGSICAFEPTDGTWLFGDPLVDLLDFYSVWAVRQLHLRVFGTWPGPQAVPHAYERILEFNDHELCGCGSRGKLYKDCCRGKDGKLNQLAEGVCFALWSKGIRQAPAEIVQFARARSNPPPLSKFLG